MTDLKPEPDIADMRRQLRNAFGHFATGVVVVTATADSGRHVGVTVNSFNTVSLDPPLILWSLDLRAPSLSVFRSSDYFTVNILSADQKEHCKRFSTPAPDKFSGLGYTLPPRGGPLLIGALASFECAVYARYEGGDHEIYVGEVLSYESSAAEPLVYYKGQFKALEHEPAR